jgi:hypothetical protein
MPAAPGERGMRGRCAALGMQRSPDRAGWSSCQATLLEMPPEGRPRTSYQQPSMQQALVSLLGRLLSLRWGPPSELAQGFTCAREAHNSMSLLLLFSSDGNLGRLISAIRAPWVSAVGRRANSLHSLNRRAKAFRQVPRVRVCVVGRGRGAMFVCGPARPPLCAPRARNPPEGPRPPQPCAPRSPCWRSAFE